MTSEDDGMPSQGSSGLGASQESAGTTAREVRSDNSVEEATYIARWVLAVFVLASWELSSPRSAAMRSVKHYSCAVM